MPQSPDSLELILRVLAAALFGGLIGLERDLHGRAAGLRTHVLVSAGAALFCVLSLRIPGASGADPGRIAAQVVTGIGFLGAGAIIKGGLTVRGLTTAACLWVVAAIGMCAGAGEFALAAGTTMISLFCLIVLKRVERLYRKDTYRSLRIETGLDVDLQGILSVVSGGGVTVLHVDVAREHDSGTMTLEMSLRLFHRGITDGILAGIIQRLEETGIPLKSVRWRH